MNDKALLAIVSALGDYTEPPANSAPESEKENAAFSRWAIEEILDLVWDHPWTEASETIAAFAMKLEMYAREAVTDDQKRIFSIASIAAWKLLKEIEEVERG